MTIQLTKIRYLWYIILSSIIILLTTKNTFAQETFEILIDSSEYLVDFKSDLSRDIKILATDNRMIIVDYENVRILFYEKGTSLTDNQIITIIGSHSRVQNGLPYDQNNYNRLSAEFTADIYDNQVWVANYSYGEVLIFDLDGNHITSYPYRMRIFAVDDTALYAVNDGSLYNWDASADTFAYLKELPDEATAESAQYGTNVKIGYNRLVINMNDSLKIYDLTDFLSHETYNALFIKYGSPIPDFEIMPDGLVWITSYNSSYIYCSLEGDSLGSGTFGFYPRSLHFASDNRLYFHSHTGVKIYDSDLVPITSESRTRHYWKGQFLGTDAEYLYFYDFSDGGFVFASIDTISGIYLVKRENEIPYSGWWRQLRSSGSYRFLLSEWPQDSLKIYRFNMEDQSYFNFGLDSAYSFDIANDLLYVLSGDSVKSYTKEGQWTATFALNSVAGSNLHNLTRDSYVSFTTNGDKFFVVYNDTLNIFSKLGVFENLFPFPIRSNSYTKTQLFSDQQYVYSNGVRYAIDFNTGEVSDYLQEYAGVYGYIWNNQYWYESGYNIFSRQNIKVISGIEHEAGQSDRFRLLGNYPNPFNPTTKIRYQLPVSDQVELSIYNILGQKIITLVSGKQQAGFHEIEWDASGYASGLYFYYLKAGNASTVKKAMLIK